jgi:hypothetical protein
MATRLVGYYSHLNDMKQKAAMEDAEARGEKLEKGFKVFDPSKLEQKPVVKVQVKVGKH